MKKYFYLAIAITIGVIAGLYAIAVTTINILEGLLAIIAWILIAIVAFYGLRIWLRK